MSISIELRDEVGKALRRLTEGTVDLPGVMPSLGDPDFPMLGYVDPYGDTTFNSLQMKAVIPEIGRLKKQSADTPPVLDELLELAEECQTSVHTYLVFIGD